MNATTDNTRATPAGAAAYASQIIREALVLLTVHDGLTRADALAGAHAAIVTEMVMAYGGAVAAERCTTAAARVADLPSVAAVKALMDQPAGHA